MDYSLLNTINNSQDVSALPYEKLEQLYSEVRHFLIENVSKTGGHLSANLGTVEIITAMHYSFSTPQDQFVFDVGHQCYTHKIYTGRREKFDGLRKLNGISGFPAPSESEDDVFIAGHGSTSISLAIGLAKAKKIKNEPGYIISVIGDGAFTGGMVYEGLNNIDKTLNNLIIILNDNKMSISKNVGSVPAYLSKLRPNTGYLNIKENVNKTLNKTPLLGKVIRNTIITSKNLLRRSLYQSSTFFEELGFTYHLIEDGNNIGRVCSALEASKRVDGPVFIHAITTKGKGFTPAEENPGEFHGVSAFDLDNVPDPDVAPKDSYSTIFGKNLSARANDNNKLCAITAMMYQTVWMAWYNSKNINRWPFKNFLKQMLINSLTVLLSIVICSFIKLPVNNYIDWFILACIYAIILFLLTLVINMIFYKPKVFYLYNVTIGKFIKNIR